MEIDIRFEKETVDSIRVQDQNKSMSLATLLVKGKSFEDCVCWLEDGGDTVLGITDKEHAQNLIKAIQKAIDLGWFD